MIGSVTSTTEAGASIQTYSEQLCSETMSGCADSEPYALQVLGDSMQPEFDEGEVIIVEPGNCIQQGAYVIAMHDGEYIFRQLFVKDDELYLKPINDFYPTLKIDSVDSIKGRVISKSRGAGRQTKTYI